MARIIIRFIWTLFALALGAGLWALATPAALPLDAGILRIDALTLFLAAAVTFVSGIVHSVAGRYMDGAARIDAFFGRLAALTVTVLLLLAADHMVLFVAAWTLMGLLLAGLIGHADAWPQARAAAALARNRFLAGSAAVAAGFALLGAVTGSWRISAAMEAAGTVPVESLALACAAFGLATAIQCGLFPFHRWLVGSMTAPTPVSAFMHAGLVNAGGILLVRTAPVFTAVPEAMTAIVVLGAASALFGAAASLVQADVKRGLAASTTAQMGFMVLQCGLGFHGAAMAHLVLHGFYKAFLFLGAGSALSAAGRPGPVPTGMDGRAVALALPCALLAGLVFAMVSGKAGDWQGSGSVLVLFAAIAAAQAGLALRGWQPDRPGTLLLAAPLLVAVAAAFYGAVVALAQGLLAGVPGVLAPQPLNPVHLAVSLAFIAAWLAVTAGLHRRSTRLYTRLLCLAQPAGATITDRRGLYRA